MGRKFRPESATYTCRRINAWFAPLSVIAPENKTPGTAPAFTPSIFSFKQT
jgi:hypothetical protein